MKTNKLQTYSIEREIYGSLLDRKNVTELEQTVASDILNFVTTNANGRVTEYNYLIQFHIAESNILYLEGDVQIEYERNDSNSNYLTDFIKELQGFFVDNKITKLEKISYYFKISVPSIEIELNTASYEP